MLLGSRPIAAGSGRLLRSLVVRFSRAPGPPQHLRIAVKLWHTRCECVRRGFARRRDGGACGTNARASTRLSMTRMSQEHEIGDTIGGRQNFLGVRNRLPVE